MTGNGVNSNEEALISWSALAEPADTGAAWLVSTLGAERALAWVRLAGVNPVMATMELAQVAPPQQVDEALRVSEKWIARLDVADPSAHLERAASCGARVITRGSAQWPPCLDDLGPLAPFALWVRGGRDLALLMATSIAIVGARSATAYGEHVAVTIAGELADRGATVVSGGAYGIDAAAHRTVLTMGDPTVAFMAGGVDRLYPVGNADLLERVLDGGVAVSEVPPGYAPQRARFLTRNRLIATSRATVVVEAAVRSGALSTARHAAAMLRPVGAVPGPVTSASSAGCHALVRDGLAMLVTRGADVLEFVEPVGSIQEDAVPTSNSAPASHGARVSGEPSAPKLEFATSAQRQAYGAMGRKGADVAAVAKESGLTLSDTRAALGGLEIAGLATRAGPRWQRKGR